MVCYKILFKKSAQKDLKKIPKGYISKILEKIEILSKDPYPTGCKKLANSDSYRIRIADYRVIYSVYDVVEIVQIERIRHRKEVYR